MMLWVMIRKEKVSDWIENNQVLITLCVSSITAVISLTGIVMATTLTWRSIGKIMFAFVFLIVLLISSVVAIKSALSLICKPLNDEIKKIQSELEEEIKQYDELAKEVELPKAVDKAITVEKNPDWGILHPYKEIIQHRKRDAFPHLYFYMRVINRTYYYFEPEEVKIGCFFNNDEDIGDGKWVRGIDKSEIIIEVDPLRKFGDGDIVVQFPIKELYGDLNRWNIRGTVKYSSKESLIEDNKQYANPEIDIRLEYVLPKEQVMKLKEEVEKALGDER